MTVDTQQILEQGRIEMEGLVSWGSNYTFLVTVCLSTAEEEESVEPLQAMYKPRRGERPLWDFPSGTLWLRERAAYLISETLGWQIVPLTILRDGPQGQGSVQLFIEHDPERTFFDFQPLPHFQDSLRQIALFDILINNADRKGGHVIEDGSGKLWGIDHGICFHVEDKLRSVIWDYAGQPIPADMLASLEALAQGLAAPEAHPLLHELPDLLSQREQLALQRRLDGLLANGRFITPGPGRHYPWPLI